MRLQDFLASALVAAFAVSAQEDGYITSISTYTITRTVERVVETAWATASSDTALPHEPTFSAYPIVAPSAVAPAGYRPLPHVNGTQPALASSGLPSSTVSMSHALPQATGNAAVRIGGPSYAFAAIAGIVGLAAL